MKTWDIALRLKAHTADAAMLFLNIMIKKERSSKVGGESGRNRKRYSNNYI